MTEYVTERHTFGGPGPEGQPDTVDESASAPVAVEAAPEQVEADEPEQSDDAPAEAE